MRESPAAITHLLLTIMLTSQKKRSGCIICIWIIPFVASHQRPRSLLLTFDGASKYGRQLEALSNSKGAEVANHSSLKSVHCMAKEDLGVRESKSYSQSHSQGAYSPTEANGIVPSIVSRRPQLSS
jgi:hypothetical protein